MQTPNNHVRVFISSTFRDMHAERDHLVTVVFPELRERVERLGLEFFDVDLRWGVPSKDANGETANSWEYCRQWIDRVEPFFFCILGQRYGWVPEVKDFKDDADQARQEIKPRSITDLEVRHAVLDTNRKPRSYFYLRATDAPADANEYVDPKPLLDKLVELKKEVRACGRPVQDYHPEWTGEQFTGMEAFGQLVLEDLWSGVLRDERYVSKEVWHQVLGADPDTDSRYTDESTPVPPELWEKIVALAKPPLKDRLDAEREQMLAFATSRLHGFQGRTHELQQLTDFISATTDAAPRLAVVAAVPGQGKSALIAKLHQQLSELPQVDTKASAPSGTSSFIPHPTSFFLITHFVGATESSVTAQALVDRLLGELDRSGIEWPADEQKDGEEPKRDFNSLCLRLAKRLGDYEGETRVLILLDALNQLSDGHGLYWLPQRLGPNVRVVVSCVEDASQNSEVRDQKSDRGESLTTEQRVPLALSSRQPAPLRVPLGPLTDDDVRIIVVGYLKEYCHELDREHLDMMCAVTQARNPLYLRVMLNELRTLGGNDLNVIVPARIASMSRDYPDTVALFRWVLQRLEVFGAEAVQWWCLYLAHSRVGMASHELADLLARKLGADAAATALLIERGLRRYLLRRGGQLDFFHGQLRQAVMQQYGLRAEPVAVHREMADYFTTCAKGTDPLKEWETDGVRGFSECVFHHTQAGQQELAAGLLSHFPFLLHKLRVGLLEGVFENYEMLRCEAAPEVVNQLGIWSAFFRENAHILRRGNAEWPAHRILLQLAVEHADDSPLTLGAEQWLAEDRCDWIWLRRNRRLPHVRTNPCLAVLEGHSKRVEGTLALADERVLSWADDGTLRLWSEKTGLCIAVLEGHSDGVAGVLALTDGRILSWSYDETLRLWDGKSGQGLAVLKGHSERVKGALVLADGRILSWSEDKTLRLWDGKSAQCIAVLEGHSKVVRGALELADDRILSWSMHTPLRLWDGRSGQCLAVLEGHSRWDTGALALVNGSILSWSNDDALRLLDGTSGQCLAVLEGHSGWVTGALALADDRILSWSMDKTLRLWDGKSGQCLAVLKGHSDWVTGALALTDGRILSWSQDKTLRLWDANSGQCLAVLEGHSGWVTGALVLADGHILSWAEKDYVSGSIDKTLRLWDGKSGQCLAALDGHSESVNGALALADGRILSWSDDKTLRIWDGKSGQCLAGLEGHSRSVDGVLALADDRILSWAADSNTLRLWDVKSGRCLVVLEGHSERVKGALVLTDGHILSWANDDTLRLWDRKSGQCLAVLVGHSGPVEGVLLIAGGRILSRSYDDPLRIWDGKSGQCLAVLEGHSRDVRGTLVLADGRILSWSQDNTLRIWDEKSGQCLAVLEGHSDWVTGALALADDRILSWSLDETLRLWDGTSGHCLEVESEELAERNCPEWIHARERARRIPGRFSGDWFASPAARSASLRHKSIPSCLAIWNADSAVTIPYLQVDGTLVVTLANGQVCFLNLHHGQRRISLAEAEAILVERRDLSAISDQPQVP
ncbi:MAG: DUF4062 domain-containing protein [Verrucomicrobia bacterium]|nr:MAG: DUF4062 domain-containing protein [Verrucomicrobiota bacterium]